MKILVVDDEKIILQGIAKLLKANSLVSEVYCAEDAFIALDFLKCHRVVWWSQISVCPKWMDWNLLKKQKSRIFAMIL